MNKLPRIMNDPDNIVDEMLEDGMKVKIDMRFRGRMMTRLEVGRKIMDSFIEECADIATVEKKPLLEGNTMSTVMAPKKK